MVGISADAHTTEIVILGHGLTVPERSELAPGVLLEPSVPKVDLVAASASSRTFSDYLACVTASELATFCLRVQSEPGRELVERAWNALWLFHLLSLACASPCFSLCAIAKGKSEVYSSANRNIILGPLPVTAAASPAQIAWARESVTRFDRLVAEPAFSSAMRCYGNAHYLYDLDTRIMLLWAGIEGLLAVDAELNRRIALYAALLHRGSAEEKTAHFQAVKKAYAIRSRVVHGGKASPDKLKTGYQAGSSILAGLLARCVEIGRVPSTDELDALAVANNLA
jgi:Apea-like HEPN